MAHRFIPTADKATELRASLASVGCKARVARQRHAYRIVPANPAEIELAASAARNIGLTGPVGGDISRSANCLFAYDVRVAA